MKFLLLAMLALATAERVRYDGYKVYTVNCVNEAEKEIISNMEGNVNIWRHNKIIGQASDVLVSPARDYWFRSTMEENNMAYSVKVEDLQTLVDENYAVADSAMDWDLNGWNTLTEIYDEMEVMVTDCTALGLDCSTRSFGTTHEGNSIKGLVVKTGDAGKPGLWLDCTIHAREWVATAVCNNFMHNISRGYGNDEYTTLMLDYFDWYIIPVVNPDGYAYTHSDERMWRKNRRPNDGICIGTDLNRNFEVDWGTFGCSGLECSDTYCGDYAASEEETQVIQGISTSLHETDNVIAWVTAHTYGEMFMHSYGTTEDGTATTGCKRSPDHDHLYQVAEETVVAIESVYNEANWIYGSICETIYEASGNTVDYVHGTSQVKYVYTPELRGSGFAVSTDEIYPAFIELWVGVHQMVQSIYAIEFP